MFESNSEKAFQIDKIDESILKAYAKEFGPSLIRNFQKRGAQKATAEDLAQNVFLRLAKRVSGGEIENPKAYLMQTASSVWNDHLRKRQRQQHKNHLEYEDGYEDGHAHAPVGFSPKRVLEGREALQLIVEALNNLPERTRIIYVLCRIEGLKRGEVAGRIGISVSAVDKHLITATAYIGKCFGDRL